MAAANHQELLRLIPPITELLKSVRATQWLKIHPAVLVTDCLRGGTASVRQQLLQNGKLAHSTEGLSELVLARAARLLEEATSPRLRTAINATGIILHTGLGRAVFPERVVDSMIGEMKGYCTLAASRDTGERIERDELVEDVLKELTGAEAATVVNNNAAATMLVLAGLARGREVIVSRGQLIEIGGSFRLPEVMAESQAKLVEVGATNRTHLKDYQKAITPQTAALMRVHPSNYRIVGFTTEPELRELAELAHSHNLLLVDDLGAGALVDLKQFGLPHEPTVRESIQAGADVVLFSGDKLIGASQCGIIVGRKPLINALRKHPLMRALRVDKTCLMVLERTLHMFRDPESLRREHPAYRMISTPVETLETRARSLVDAVTKLVRAESIQLMIRPGSAYVGSGSLPTEALPSVVVSITVPGVTANELARRLRLDAACVFGRIEADQVCLDMRTITDEQASHIAAALARVVSSDQAEATASHTASKGVYDKP